jgi:tetratricopeptide (TPR) repeat protein
VIARRCLALVVALAFLSFPPPAGAAVRDEYADPGFSAPLSAGLRAFYTRDFTAAGERFEAALRVVPDNTLALAFLHAAAVQVPGEFERVVETSRTRVTAAPNDYVARLRLGFAFLFASAVGRNRDAEAREQLDAAVALDPKAAAAHVGRGILWSTERSASRAKPEFLAALAADEHDVLAREYLASIYQTDLKDPQRALTYIIDVPNLVPDYADINFHLASLLHDLKQSDLAIVYATRGLELDVGHVGEAGRHGYTLLARIYLDRRRLDDARRVLRASIENRLDVVYANTLLRKLENGDYGTPAAPAGAPAPARTTR